MEPVDAIERFRRRLLNRRGCEPGARQLGKGFQGEAVGGGVLQRPERRRKLGGRGLQKGRKIDVEGAEADAVLAQLGARLLIEALHHVGDQLALQHAEALGQPERDPPRQPRHVLGLGDVDQRLQAIGDEFVAPRLEAGLHLLAIGAGQMLIRQQSHLRLQGIVGGLEGRDLLVAPKHPTGARQLEGVRLGGSDTAGPHAQLTREDVGGGAACGLAVDAFRLRLGRELKPAQAADEVVLDMNGAIFGNLRREFLLVAQTLHQGTGAPIDEALRQLLVECVRQAVLDGAGAGLPVGRVLQPIGAVGDEGPGADVGDAVGERVDVAIGAIGEGNLLGEPVLRHAALRTHQVAVERADHLGVALGGDLAIVGKLANLPQALHGAGAGREPRDLAIVGQRLESDHVVSHAGAGEARLVRQLAQTIAEAIEGRKVETAIAPLQHAHVVEGVRLEALDEIGLERLAVACNSECAVVHMTAGATGDLAYLVRRQITKVLAIELAHGGKCDMVDVEVEAHANGIGGDEKIDIARLIKRDLRIAGAGRKGAEHDGRATALPADQLGNGVDLVGGERDHGRPAGQARDLLLARIGEARQARA